MQEKTQTLTFGSDDAGKRGALDTVELVGLRSNAYIIITIDQPPTDSEQFNTIDERTRLTCALRSCSILS
jgi:hypothetical protein